MIIGIVGRVQDPAGRSRSIGAGKDTVAGMLTKCGYTRVALADPIKRAARLWWDLTPEQLWGSEAQKAAPDLRYPKGDGAYLTPREICQKLGTEVARNLDADVWVRVLLNTAAQLTKSWYSYDPQIGLTKLGDVSELPESKKPLGVVVPDVRFKNEVKAIRAAGGKVVLVQRETDTIFGEDEVSMHSSENDLNKMSSEDFDYILHNNGSLHNLEDRARQMLNVLNGRIREYDPRQADVPPFKRTVS